MRQRKRPYESNEDYSPPFKKRRIEHNERDIQIRVFPLNPKKVVEAYVDSGGRLDIENIDNLRRYIDNHFPSSNDGYARRLLAVFFDQVIKDVLVLRDYSDPLKKSRSELLIKRMQMIFDFREFLRSDGFILQRILEKNNILMKEYIKNKRYLYGIKHVRTVLELIM